VPFDGSDYLSENADDPVHDHKGASEDQHQEQPLQIVSLKNFNIPAPHQSSLDSLR